VFVESKYSFALIFKGIISQIIKFIKLNFSNACIRCEHSARTSTHDRAEALTHYPQRYDVERLPPGGRIGRLSPTKNTTREISLVVFVFSPQKMQSGKKLFIYFLGNPCAFISFAPGCTFSSHALKS